MVLNRVGRREHGFEPFLILIRSLTFNKLGNLSVPQFSLLQNGDLYIGTYWKGCYKD